MTRDILLPLLSGACVLLFGWLLWDGFRKGEMQCHYRALHLHGRRDDQPIRFWLTAAAISFWLFAGLFGTLWWLFN